MATLQKLKYFMHTFMLFHNLTDLTIILCYHSKISTFLVSSNSHLNEPDNCQVKETHAQTHSLALPFKPLHVLHQHRMFFLLGV